MVLSDKLEVAQQLLNSAHSWAVDGDTETAFRIIKELNHYLIMLEPQMGAPHGDKDSY